MITRSFLKNTVMNGALWGAFFMAFAFTPVVEEANSQQQVIQKIEALVNDEAITAYDVGQRMGLVLLATGRQLTSQEELLELRAQVLENLIDEKLQTQEAVELEVPVPEEEVFEVYARVARSYNRTEDDFHELLESYGSSANAIRTQIEAEFAWQSLVNGRFGSYAEAKDDEIQGILDDMKANEGKREYRLSEIFLNSPNPSQDERVKSTAQRIRDQLDEGDGAFQFGNVARQFSQSTTAAQGGDLGWIPEDQMPPELLAAVQSMEILDISNPIKTSGGYYLVALTDRRSIMKPEPLDENLDLRQIGWFFTRETTEDQAKAWFDNAVIQIDSFNSCENLGEFVGSLGDGVVARELGNVPLKQLNPELRDILYEIPPGGASDPINTPEGFVIFVICDRHMPAAELPSPLEIEQQIETQRIAMMGRRYLRDLRRDAIIEYK